MSRKIDDPIIVVSRLPGVRIAVVLLYLLPVYFKFDIEILHRGTRGDRRMETVKGRDGKQEQGGIKEKEN